MNIITKIPRRRALLSASWRKTVTAKQAAMVAKAAGVGKLLLGHYSARYNDETVLLKEAKEVFEESYLTNEGMVISV